MKCPNCGMDIVIATHLCPHCGYAHDFDGSIEPRRDIPEPWEISPERSRKKRERRERAASAWARSRAGRGAPDEGPSPVREADGSEEKSPAKGAGGLLHRFAMLTIAAAAVLLIFGAMLNFTGAYCDMASGYSSEHVYSRLPELRSLDKLLGAAYALCALACFSALSGLRMRRRSGVKAFYFAAGLFAAANLAYDAAVSVIYGLGPQLLLGDIAWLVPLGVYVALMALHFRRSAASYSW